MPAPFACGTFDLKARSPSANTERPIPSTAATLGARPQCMSESRRIETRKRKVGLDRIDRSILRALRQDGRITFQALSGRVGLSPRPCLERVRRLEQRGIIRGYAAIVEPTALGHDIIALAAVALRDPSAGVRQRLERALCAHPSVVELHVVNGEYDYIARIVAPTLASYEALTEAFLADPAFGIARVHTTFVLKTLRSFDGYPVGEAEE
jgi:DNA-binding Lrp family transcriptional regulator